MPFIDSKVSIPVSKEQGEEIRRRLDEAISIIPGKSKEWLMVGIQDNYDLYFRDDAACAFVDVSIFGPLSNDAAEKMTAEITHIFNEELLIAPDHIYVKYEQAEQWGWSGRNF